jgi:radical SAM protein with 4Fe4S-binding SPASM domain
MLSDKQESLGIPFSKNQTVIARNLKELVAQAGNLAGRPVIVHVERSEISKIAEGLLYIQDKIGAVRLCLRDINLLTDNDLQTYHQQLARIADIGLMKQAMGTEGKLNVLNLSILASNTGPTVRCIAGTGFITIGPDGLIYPCPAFYYAGQSHSIGTIRDISDVYRKLGLDQQQCDICGSDRCPGCRFLESSRLAGKERICKVYEAEKRATQELIQRVGRSGYLFDCLRTLKARECAKKSQQEGGDSVSAGKQVYEVTFEEFVLALKDFKLAAEALIKGNGISTGDEYNGIIERWSELAGIPSESQRSIFRRRVRETIIELGQLRRPG